MKTIFPLLALLFTVSAQANPVPPSINVSCECHYRMMDRTRYPDYESYGRVQFVATPRNFKEKGMAACANAVKEMYKDYLDPNDRGDHTAVLVQSCKQIH